MGTSAGSRSKLGRWGEEFVAKHLGFKRVPFSGSVWPYLEDLERTRRGNKELAQVKTTESDAFLVEWMKLCASANSAEARPRWFSVVRQPGAAYIFETTLVKEVILGIGGEGDGL